MTRDEYQAYQERVKQFMDSEGINNLSPKLSDEESPSFSAMPCDCCKTTLAGDRWTASGYNPTTKEVHHFDSVCNDCIYYAEYGQLDDMTMADMEE